MPPRYPLERLLAELGVRPRASARELMAALGLGSQATLLPPRDFGRRSRHCHRHAPGRAVMQRPATSAAWAAILPSPGRRVGVGRPRWPSCDLSPPKVITSMTRAHCRDGCEACAATGAFDGLPLFLVDARPQGFLGRGFARRHAELELRADPDTWSDDDVVVALARAGEDVVGDLVVGDASARRLYEARVAGRRADRARAASGRVSGSGRASDRRRRARFVGRG